ncbi:MAG: MICOS complex subunit MIC60 [Oscillospiraceae bacterium]|nr:MICOS complex subunit MIC60 [Oscillospiraceae bacterium]
MAEKIICNPEVFSSRAYPAKNKAKRVCFVIMPFSSEGDENRRIQDVYNHHIVKIAEQCGLECIRADNKRYFRSGRPIIEQIWQAICTADIIIGDFTTANPNVTYEAGLAHSIGKPLIGIVQQGEKIPFDYQHLRHIPYTTTHEGYAKLDSDLEIEIIGYMKELEHQEQYPQKYVEATDTAAAEKLRLALQKQDALQNEKDALIKENDGHLEQIAGLSAQIAGLEKKLAASRLQMEPSPHTKKPPPKRSDILKKGNPHHIGPDALEWLVLDVDEKENKALLITKDIVKEMPYHASGGDITWEHCSLRKYLNGEFYEEFSEDDRKRIKPTQNQNPHTRIDTAEGFTIYTRGGNPTPDSIFLLSIEEAKQHFHTTEREIVILWTMPKTYPQSDELIAKYGKKPAWWWLRSSGNIQDKAANVFDDGSINLAGAWVGNDDGGVRPALWVRL